MTLSEKISERFNTRWKRCVLVVTCIPLIGMAVMTLITAYFYQATYFQDRYFVIFSCHKELAQRDQKNAYRIAQYNSSHGLFPSVRALEHSREFTECLRSTRFMARKLANLEWAFVETLRFGFWSALALGLLASLNKIERVIRWIAMRPN